jgi:glycerol-3-phosphate acyltransferase PlsX
MGGDHAPCEIVRGVGEALDKYPGRYHLVVVGVKEQIDAELSAIGKLDHPDLTVLHASQVVRMDDSPAAAIRSKRDSSINVCIDQVKKGKAQAAFCAGNTGAAVAATVLKLRTLEGIERPGIATVFPSPTGRFLLLDAGATVDCKPIHLVHYAIMGDAYARSILSMPNPRVGVLSVGQEESKGNDLTRETFRILRTIPDINFVGNVEGHDLFAETVDVVVCDGFVGNVVLKCCESLARALSRIIKEKLKKTVVRKAGYLLSRNAYLELKQMSDVSEYGGAPLLGVNGVCIIGHGSSSARGVCNGIRVAGEVVEQRVNDHILERIKHLGMGSGKLG